MNKQAGEQKIAYKYPPAKEFPSVIYTALGALAAYGLGYFIHQISVGMYADPVVGCNSVGCAPGLVGLVALIFYLIAAGLGLLAYYGLLTFLRRWMIVLFIIFGAGGIALALFNSSNTQKSLLWLAVGLLASGLLALLAQLQYRSFHSSQ